MKKAAELKKEGMSVLNNAEHKTETNVINTC